jgi:hypothetical protein
MNYQAADRIVNDLVGLISERQVVMAQRTNYDLPRDMIEVCNLAYLKGYLASLLVETPGLAEQVESRAEIIRRDIESLRTPRELTV